jgi:hypothetical protein
MKLKIADDTSLQKGRRFVQSAGLIFYGLAAQGLLTAAVGWYLYFDVCLDRGNRAGVFPRQRRPVPAVPAGLAVAAEESAPPRRLEPSLALPGEQAG